MTSMMKNDDEGSSSSPLSPNSLAQKINELEEEIKEYKDELKKLKDGKKATDSAEIKELKGEIEILRADIRTKENLLTRLYELQIQQNAQAVAVPQGVSQDQFSEIIGMLTVQEDKLSQLEVMDRKLDVQGKISKLMAKEVQIAHRTRMDKWTSSKRSREESTDFKNNLITFYGCAHPTDPNQIKCMVLNQYFPKSTVIASHIWKFCTEGEGLTEFNLEPADLNNNRNGLLMCKAIEEAFDVKGLCFLIDRIRCEELFIKVLDPKLMTKPVLPPTVPPTPSPTFSDIDGNQLHCPLTDPTDPSLGKNLPFRRILDFHAKCSFETAINKGWILPSETFENFFDMSVGASIPDLNMYQDLDSDIGSSATGASE